MLEADETVVLKGEAAKAAAKLARLTFCSEISVAAFWEALESEFATCGWASKSFFSFKSTNLLFCSVKHANTMNDR